MLKKLLKTSKCVIHGSLLIVSILATSSCTQEKKKEVIDIQDITPKAEGDYDYIDSSSSDNITLDRLSQSLLQEFGSAYESIDLGSENFVTSWSFIPDRVETDSSFNKVFMIDSTLTQVKSWYFKDSIRTVNALYNWLDCFGPDCKGISIGDSVNVSKESFILFQNDTQIHFVKSKTVNFKRWETFFTDSMSRKSNFWNYIIKQRDNDVVQWETPVYN